MNMCDPLSVAIITATVTVSCMMASKQEKVNSLFTGQCNFCQTYGSDPPLSKVIQLPGLTTEGNWKYGKMQITWTM
jgi:hypothetical protein